MNFDSFVSCHPSVFDYSSRCITRLVLLVPIFLCWFTMSSSPISTCFEVFKVGDLFHLLLSYSIP
uniref:Uncharacterized protein n=1 Tax=Aegilops tauschii subsp. strangulata TaxID=200361 RepID=A0A453SZ64_AEGTS